MTVALISDIHGNLAALETVLYRIDALDVSSIICLGDVAGYYPHVNACVDILRERDIACLMGNHDFYLATGTHCERSNSVNACLDYQCSVVRPDVLEWLRGLPRQMHWESMQLVHAGWLDPLEEYIVPSEDYFAPLAGEVFASGHSHVQYIWQGSGKTYCNPGSVGQPRDGDSRAAFAVWDGAGFVLHRTEYDISRTEAAMAAAGFSDYFFENLRKGSRIGGKIDLPPSPQS